jgi:hypothetical protein
VFEHSLEQVRHTFAPAVARAPQGQELKALIEAYGPALQNLRTSLPDLLRVSQTRLIAAD